MKRILTALFILLYFEIGVLLLLIPWTGSSPSAPFWASVWTKNYFVNHSPWMAALAKNYFVRGAVSGVGLADMWLAAYELWHLRRRAPS